ncbi:hypothetical protein [Mesorhizobium sp. B2-4-19]|uniref:hypothetical protein n=1 Tax=Mesorhizobium sp. B2-4-19 TaxID=2589930 RepID=UPI001FEF17BC|nr:hypothetical protein [Mesorhizobium sp. B2-4-19]
MTKIEFKRTGCGLKPDIRPSVIKGAPVRPDMRDDDVVVRIDVAAAPVLPPVLPYDIRVVLDLHGSEDTRNRLVPLPIGHGLTGRQAEMVTGDRGARPVPQRLHVVQCLGSGVHRRGDTHDARPLPVLFRQVG